MNSYFRRLISSKTSSFAETSARKLSPFGEIPGPKPLPLIGNIWRYLPLVGDYQPDTLFENAQFNQRRYGKIVREKITEKHTILHLFKPEDIESFFRQDGKFPCRRSHRALLKYRHDRPKDYNDGGLFPENGPSWYNQRSKFQQRLMSKSQVSLNIPKLELSVRQLIKWIDAANSTNDGEKFSIEGFETLVYKWALGNTLSVFLDLDIEELKSDFLEELINNLHNSLISTDKTEIQTNRWEKFPDKCPHYRMLAESQDFLHKFVKKQIESFKVSQINRDNTEFSYLREWLRSDGIESKDVITFIIDSLMAGLHTTSYMAMFLLYNISNNDECLEILEAELEEKLTGQSELTNSDVDNLTYLRDCLKETLRLNPVSIGTGRVVSHDGVTLSDYQIPNGTMVITQNQAISQDESVYAQASEFLPARWSEYRSVPRHLRPSPFATLPFGFGARACIGQRLAELQIKLMAIRLFQRYKINFLHEIPVKTKLIHTIAGPVGVEFGLK